MNRQALLDTLLTVSPALADNDLVPPLSHLWFRGQHVMACNNQIAISAPCKTDFVGAVPGELLIKLLKNSLAKDVEFLPSETELGVKTAGSRFKLAILQKEAFLFDVPAVNAEAKLPIPIKPLLDGIRVCLKSVDNSDNAPHPQYTGITLAITDKGATLYSTNGATMSRARIIAENPTTPLTVILSETFCEQLLALKGDVHLEVHDDYALASNGNEADGDNVVLFGRLVDTKQQLDFAHILNDHLPEGWRKQAVPIPPRLPLVLERAIVVGEAGQDYGSTEVTATEGKVKFVTRTSRGEVIDLLKVEGQPDVSTTISCQHVKAGLGLFDKMLVTDRSFTMTNKTSLYLVASNAAK